MSVRITVGLGATINMGNYETIRVDYSEARDVPEDDLVGGRESLYEDVDKFIDSKITEIKRDAGL